MKEEFLLHLDLIMSNFSAKNTTLISSVEHIKSLKKATSSSQKDS